MCPQNAGTSQRRRRLDNLPPQDGDPDPHRGAFADSVIATKTRRDAGRTLQVH